MKNRIFDHSFIRAIFNTQLHPPIGYVGEDAKELIFEIVRKQYHPSNMEIVDLSAMPMWFDIVEEYNDLDYASSGDLIFNIQIPITIRDKDHNETMEGSFYLYYNVKDGTYDLDDEGSF